MTDEELQKEVQKHKDDIDDYYSSVLGLFAFAESACWDDEKRERTQGTQICIPRTMTKILDDGDLNITPDSVIQISNEYGVVAEMKKHFNEFDHSCFEQMEKYDDNLVGWWTENEKIDSHDLVLLTHYFSSTDAIDAFKSWCEGGNSFKRPFAIVEFTWSEGGQRYFSLKKIEGSISDSLHDEHLRKGKPIPEKIIIEGISNYKFYDADPPLIHMLQLIYDQTLTSFPEESEFDPVDGKQYPVISVSIKEVRDKMHELFVPEQHTERQPKLPKKKWVKDALEMMVKIQIAEKDTQNPDRYKIMLKKRKKDTIEYFVHKISKKNKSLKQPTNEQLKLFDTK